MRPSDAKLSNCNSAQPYLAKAVAERGNEGENVYLLTYDLSGGLARELSHAILGRSDADLIQFKCFQSIKQANLLPSIFSLEGKQIEAIWHTSILFHGKEYFFGQNGINVVNYNVG